MNIDDAVAKLKQYEEIVDRHLKPTHGSHADDGKAAYHTIRSACVGALICLEGDEAKFNACLVLTMDQSEFLGTSCYYSHPEATKDAGYMRNLAQVVSK